MKWYSFRKRKIPVITPILYYFTPFNKKVLGTNLLWVHIIEGKWQHELILNKHYEKAGNFLVNKILKDKNFLKKLLKKTKKIARVWLTFCRGNLKDLKNKTDKKLLEILDRYYGFYENFSVVNIPPWLFLPEKLSSYLMKKIAKFTKENINDICVTLSTSNTMSYTQEEELESLSLAIGIKKKRITNFANLSDFKKLVKNYFWLPFDYLGPGIWDEKYYQKKIKVLLRSDYEKLKNKKREILSHQKYLKRKQKNLIAKLKLPQKVVFLLEAIKDIGTLQDGKKAITTESHFYLQNLFKELAKRTEMHYSDFYFLTKEEVRDILLFTKSLKEVAKERKRCSISIVSNKKIKILAGKETKKYAKKNGFLLPSQEIEERAQELKGQVGSSGQATGKVCLIDSAKKISKIKKGEILVATMTSPDYLPAMKKAIAIVTDEGGITCHAAIVSRELRIPCVVGTKIATKVLKDGDLVEVDANTGVVRILRKIFH